MSVNGWRILGIVGAAAKDDSCFKRTVICSGLIARAFFSVRRQVACVVRFIYRLIHLFVRVCATPRGNRASERHLAAGREILQSPRDHGDRCPLHELTRPCDWRITRMLIANCSRPIGEPTLVMTSLPTTVILRIADSEKSQKTAPDEIATFTVTKNSDDVTFAFP